MQNSDTNSSNSPKRGTDGTKFRCWSAVGMLASGVALSFCGFFAPPVGEISESVLWFSAQCLIYAGSALGIDVVIDHKLQKKDS